jgi:PAS domain-containing protein
MIGVHSHRLVLESRFERIVHARAQALLASQHRAGCGAESGDCDDSLVTPTGTDPEQSFAASLSALPAAAYTTDAAGRITVYNEAAAELWGRRPELGKDRWCGSWKLYSQDGQPLPHEMCPMAAALKESRAIRGEGAVAERPDGHASTSSLIRRRCTTRRAPSSVQ